MSPSGRSKPGGVESIGSHSKILRSSEYPLVCGPLDATPISASPAYQFAARQHVALLDDTDQRAGDVERVRCIDTRHLRCLAAQQRTVRGLARLGHTGDDLGDVLGVDPARRHVVEEEQRPGTLHQHVVDAVVDDVDADAAVAAESRRQLDLRADTVGRGDQHRVVHGLDRLPAERPAEAADAAQNSRPVRAFDCLLHAADRARSLVDVDTRGGVRSDLGTRRLAKRCRGALACRRSGSTTAVDRRGPRAAANDCPRPVTASTRPPVTRAPSEPALKTNECSALNSVARPLMVCPMTGAVG